MTRKSVDDNMDLEMKVVYLFGVKLKGSGVFDVGQGGIGLRTREKTTDASPYFFFFFNISLKTLLLAF